MKSNRGFSLLETLLYLAIFAIVGGSLFGILTNVVRVTTREVSGDEVSSQLQFVMGTITSLVKDSSAIEIATSTATTTLKLRMPIAAQDPTCISLVGGVLKIAKGTPYAQGHQLAPQCNASTTDLTTDKVVVDRALFKRLEFPGGHDQVLVDMQLSNKVTGVNKISRALRSGISRVSAATFDSDLLPNQNANYEVGSSITGGKRWKNISLTGLLNLGTAGSDPGTGMSEGSVYYNSGNNTLRGYDGSAWKDIGSSLWAATSTNMYSNVAGNVGIGTTNPSALLHVGANTNISSPQLKVIGYSDTVPLQEWGDGGVVYARIGRTVGNTMFMSQANFSGNDFEFRGNYNVINQMKFPGSGIWNSSGNVGIGTTIPTTALHIYGANPSPIKLERTSAANANIQFTNTVRSMYAGLSTAGNFGIGAGQDLATAAFTVTSGGNVGIGNIAPGYKLDVTGSINASTGLCIAGNCKTDWSQVGGGGSTSSKSACASSICAIAGSDKLYWSLFGAAISSGNAAGVVPTSNIACGSGGGNTICMVAGNGQAYWTTNGAAIASGNTAGVVPTSSVACSSGAPSVLCMVSGNGQTYWTINGAAIASGNTAGVVPTSSVTCGRDSGATNSMCMVSGNGQTYWSINGAAIAFGNTAGVVSN